MVVREGGRRKHIDSATVRGDWSQFRGGDRYQSGHLIPYAVAVRLRIGVIAQIREEGPSVLILAAER